MHVLKPAEKGTLADGHAHDHEHEHDHLTPGRVVVLTAADSEIALLAAAADASGRDGGALRLAGILRLGNPHALEHFMADVAAGEGVRLILVRLLGGASYWREGCDGLAALARERGLHLAMLPGDGRPDPELASLSTLDGETLTRLNAYFQAGGLANACALLDCMDDIIDGTSRAAPPRPLLQAGLYWPYAHDGGDGDDGDGDGGDGDDGDGGGDGGGTITLATLRAHWQARGLAADAPVAAVVFYRALAHGGSTAAIATMADALIAEGLAPLPLFVASLKDAFSADLVAGIFTEIKPAVIINLTGFATASWEGGDGRNDDRSPGPFGAVACPVLQAPLASITEAAWEESGAGLTPRDLAMHVVLPELDGRIATRAIGFKTEAESHALTGARIIRSCGHAPGAGFVARLAAAWVRLGKTPPAARRIGVVLANYPNRDSRIANGVGLDTPQSAFDLLGLLAESGYGVAGIPQDSAGLVQSLLAAPTNTGWQGREVAAWLPLADYEKHFATLPQSLRAAITARWGEAACDPMLCADKKAFAIPARLYGNIAIAIQPARGHNIDPKASYHDPALVPPHNYPAFYFWLRERFGAHAVIHLGKHGNLEWLPGKALALSDSCFPDTVLGAMPHLYPFIVNDPGEGSQAKRRNAAVIVDHLTPPMTLADSHGAMAELESLMNEYFEAAGLDEARGAQLLEEILQTAAAAHLTDDCGIEDDDGDDEKLLKLDNFLCDLKEMQIRDGLHVLGSAPVGRLKDDLLASILRIPRGAGEGADASLLRALAADLGLGDFDPLTAERGQVYHGPRPAILEEMAGEERNIWRHNGDTTERLNTLASRLIAGRMEPESGWHATRAILEVAAPQIADAITQSGRDERRFLLRGLDGGFIPPGPAGAPSRGRPEVLPTGRNFFSVDSRAVPTPTAWRIGWASASALLARMQKDSGSLPRAIVLSAWGTANMRTGGDDIAQALALMGVRPEWDDASRRVVGFEILPLSVLARPRVDVTLRCSGFFRDAFPTQMALVDKVARAVGALDESPADNPIAARMRAEEKTLLAAGMDKNDAALHAGFRVFSTPPGAYGAGLQTLIDEGIWEDRDDFAAAFLQWGGTAYGAGIAAGGVAARESLVRRLTATEAVVHNRDNNEHDILDSDDYYQFAGGLAAGVAACRGSDVPVYMGDHSLPEAPKIRSLGEEITRVVRGRATNPKWLAGVMRHGYKGAFEIAATLDYLFAFAATTRQVPEHLFDACHAAWIEDKEVRDFIAGANPAALDDMLARFREAVERGLWQPRRNSIAAALRNHGNDDRREREGGIHHG